MTNTATTSSQSDVLEDVNDEAKVTPIHHGSNENKDNTGKKWGLSQSRTLVLRSYAKSPTIVISVAVLLLIAIAAIVPSLLTSGNPLNGDATKVLVAPSWSHLFGTDYLGRDIYTRTVYGTRLSVGTALFAVAISFVVGTLVGLVSGVSSFVVDSILMRLMDVVLSIPSLLVSLTIVAALGFSPTGIALAVGVPGIGQFARIMRAEVMSVRNSQYIEAALASGVRPSGVLFRHILPNAIRPVISVAILDFGMAVLAIAALSFLGFGAQPPTPEWGSLISDGHDYLSTAWWWTTFPGLVLVATVLAATNLARAIDDKARR